MGFASDGRGEREGGRWRMKNKETEKWGDERRAEGMNEEVGCNDWIINKLMEKGKSRKERKKGCVVWE
jgi:hypothetical protein